jgi:hypothetical protein
MKVAVQLPVVSVDGLLGLVATVDPLNFTVTVLVGVTKPVPVSVTPVVPTVPLIGLTDRAACTVKGVAEAALFVAASVTLTAWLPPPAAGMVNVTVEDPFESVAPPEVTVALALPTVTVSAEVDAKPRAVIVAEEPTIPLVGDSPVADEVTVKLLDGAEFDDASETTTLRAPRAAAGTAKVTVDEPFASAVLPPVMVAVFPPTVTPSAEPAAKPWAVIVADVPTAPVVGDSPVDDALTVKFVDDVAELVAASVTVADRAPLGTAGTVNVTVDDPFALEVPPEVIEAVVPATLIANADVAAKPCAVIVTDVPTAPLVGVMLVAEAFTVKSVPDVAVCDVASMTVTVREPFGTAGMANAIVDEPLELVVPPEVAVAVVPLTFTVSADDAAKPWAIIVAGVPTGPLVGNKPLTEALTVRLVADVAVFDDVSVTTTLRAPLATAGIVKATVEDPLELVVAPEVIVAALPPTVTVIAEPAAKPCAVIDAEEPTVPVVGASPVADVFTVKLVDADAAGDAVENVIVALPIGLAGTVNVAPVNAPIELVVVVPDNVTGFPPKVAVRAVLDGNPDPLAVTDVPTGPWAGDGLVTEIVELLTVTVELAALVAVHDCQTSTTW